MRALFDILVVGLLASESLQNLFLLLVGLQDHLISGLALVDNIVLYLIMKCPFISLYDYLTFIELLSQKRFDLLPLILQLAPLEGSLLHQLLLMLAFLFFVSHLPQLVDILPGFEIICVFYLTVMGREVF